MPTYKRSVARDIDKSMEVARLYFTERMKASKIAKQLRIGVNQVYSIVAKLKRNAKRITEAAGLDAVIGGARERNLPAEDQVQLALTHLQEHLRPKRRATKTLRKDNRLNDQALIQAMEGYFELHGIYNHSSLEVRKYLLEHLQEH